MTIDAEQSEHMADAAGVRLNTLRGWVNVAKSWSSQLRRHSVGAKLLVVRMDVTKRFPWTDGVGDAVYPSYFLEYLPRQEPYTVLQRCHRPVRRGDKLPCHIRPIVRSRPGCRAP